MAAAFRNTDRKNEKMDAAAIIDYFEPLMRYLAEQNEGRSCGW